MSIALFFGYVFIALFKLYRLSNTVNHALSGQARAHWRMTGEAVSLAYVFSSGFLMWAVYVAIALFWPFLLLTERFRFFHPYNAFGVARQAMRGVQKAHR